MQLDRVVRLQFLDPDQEFEKFAIEVFLKNLGPNIAVDIDTQLIWDNGQSQVERRWALGLNDPTAKYKFEFGSDARNLKLVCTYANLWGDKYQVEAGLVQSSHTKGWRVGPEVFKTLEPAS